MDQGKLTINGGTFNAGEKTVITTMGGGTHSGDIEITGGTLNGSVVLTDSSEGARLTITQKAKVNGNVTNSGKADVAITDGATVDGQVSNSAGGTMSVVNSTIGSVPEGHHRRNDRHCQQHCGWNSDHEYCRKCGGDGGRQDL